MTRWKCILQRLEIMLLFFLTLHGGYNNPTEIIMNSSHQLWYKQDLLVGSLWNGFSGRWSGMVNWCRTSMDPVIFLVKSEERCWATFLSCPFPLSFNIYFRWVHWVIVKSYQLEHQHCTDLSNCLSCFPLL